MRAILICSAMLLLTGCPHDDLHEAWDPDGRHFYTVECYGGGLTYTDCMAQASRVCQGPYEVLDKDESTPNLASTSSSEHGTKSVALGQQRRMTFRCKSDVTKS